MNGIRWNGNGKEYKYGYLLFDGEYIEGKRINKIKWDNNRCELILGGEYLKEEQIKYDNDKTIYEGEYKDGERNGKGKEYNYNKKIIFEGEYLKGKRWNGKFKE